jgi:alpha-1,2-mannosyltransferase
MASMLWKLVGVASLCLSIAIIVRELGFSLAPWSVLPMVALGLTCHPLRHQIQQGQWNTQLLLAITAAWVAGRRDQSRWAGFWIGLAATVKVFPILFLAYFAVRRNWRALASGVLSIAALTLLSVAVLGLDAYRDYITRVLPTLASFRSWWLNVSLTSFWLKNFAVGADHYGMYASPVVRMPLFAYTGIALSLAAILGTWVVTINGSRVKPSRQRVDVSFSLTVVGMLLATPVCWDHYLVLLALPLMLIWKSVGSSTLLRSCLLLLITALWISPSEFWRLGGVDLLGRWPDFHDVPPRTHIIDHPAFSLLFLSVHFFTLVSVFVWLALAGTWKGTNSICEVQEPNGRNG